ncbi:MAG: hypothetical protein H0T73_20365 [Ardenticatenales bacterium]|nr:hypothetical protein [Ardenticatenales bacterium]
MTGEPSGNEAVNGWLAQAIRYFRERGFFAAQSSLNDAETARPVRAWYEEEEWKAFIHPTPQKADMILLSLDQTRVWWEDREEPR